MKNDRPFLDFKAIKSRAPIMDVVRRYGVQLTRVNQTTQKGTCPLPSHASTTKGSFYVNEEKSVWYCHSESCKQTGKRAGGNVIDFVSAMEGVSVYEAAKRLHEWFPAIGNPATNPATAESLPESGNIPANGNRPLAFALKDVDPVHPVIQAHGISPETARVFDIGFFPGKGSMAGRIVFPLREHGHLIGYAGRTVLPVTEANPKWLLGKGLRKTFIYGLERCDPANAVILVESFWGPPFFHERGTQAAALMGSELTEEQERCLDPFPAIVVALDDDPTGKEKAARISERLKRNHHIRKARLIE
jgi:DNA primase